MKKKGCIKRILALVTASALMLSLAACGNGEQEETPEGFVYVPEFLDLSSQEDGQDISNPVLRGDYMYYSSYYWDEETQESGQIFYRWNLVTGETEELSLDMTIEGADYSHPMTGLMFDPEDNMICLLSASHVDESGEYSQAYYLLKFDQEGKQLLKQDIGEALALEGAESSYVQNAVVDNEGRLYMNVSSGGMERSNSFIVVLDKDANLIAQIDTGTDWVGGIGATEDGRVLVSRYSEAGSGMECGGGSGKQGIGQCPQWHAFLLQQQFTESGAGRRTFGQRRYQTLEI